ncbi:TlpA family protein disulfide reductase [Solicola sp. PLA-1-18]|uniref:TlpA family protein disulfide reductase n=1 Tax=Solicola sp. PLA-1-18 TaxID=3380532 RepID=UPI003B78B0A1
MSRTRVAGVLLSASVLLLAGCGGDDEPTTAPTFGGGGPTAGEADVDTPALQALRSEAGLDDCPATDASATPAPAGADGVRLPDASLDCLGGGSPVSLAALRGTPTVVNLWASWCEPCRDELPVLASLHERAGDRVRVLGVDYQDADPAAALRLAGSSGVTYPSVADPDGALRDALRVVALPQTVFVDADGSVTAVERRPYDTEADLDAAVEEHLGVTP